MMDTSKLTEKQRGIIRLLQKVKEVPSLRSWCKENNLDFNFVKGFVLNSFSENYLEIKTLHKKCFNLTKKGKRKGKYIPGYFLARKLSEDTVVKIIQLQKQLGKERYSLDFGILKKEKAIEIDQEKQEIGLTDEDTINSILRRQNIFGKIWNGQLSENCSSNNEAELDWLIKQNLIDEQETNDYAIFVKSEFQKIILKKLVTTLTKELIISNQWKDVEFKRYNIHDDVEDVLYGHSCVLTQYIHQVREIFLSMGFDEMSGQIVDSSFWNFDVLFTAQEHPARETQDTFYLTKPQTISLPDDPNFVQNVKISHEESYGSNWSYMEARKAILRTHTTASTVRNLYRLKGQDIKYFSIDKVFRNETTDKTHLAEFYQVEGVVVAPNLSVRTLIGYLSYFFRKLGFAEFRFKPTYNPYTEPSLEVHAYHAPSKSFIEVANSGIFRPEILKYLGYEGKSSVAWGLGLERIAMLLSGVETLSELVGPEINLNPSLI